MVLPTVSTKKKLGTKHSSKWIALVVFLLLLAVTTLKDNYNLMEGKTIKKSPVVVTSPVQIQKEDESGKEWFEKRRPLIEEFPVPTRRNDIIGMLEKLQWKAAIEVGVQKGLFAKRMLDSWKSCTEYKLVDLWGHEEGYKEPGDHSQEWHDTALSETKRRVNPYMDKVEFFIMRSTAAAKLIQDDHFDFVYLDARHDYCAVAEDIENYWPKVRPGGILAGHDFVDAQYAIDQLGPEQNWGVCEDGTKQPRAVRGAVEDFAAKENIDFILVSQEGFPSWFIQKPYN